MRIRFREQQWEIRGGSTARDAIKKVGLDPESVLIVVNGKLCTDDVILKDDDDVNLVAVISGGAGYENGTAVPYHIDGAYPVVSGDRLLVDPKTK